jgi:hypothetical protein
MKLKRLKKITVKEDQVQIALKRVYALDSSRISFRKASELKNIPLITLSERQKYIGLTFGSGTTTILRRAEELFEHKIIRLADLGYGLKFTHVQRDIHDYLKRTYQLNLFKNGRPGKKWFVLFKKRCKHE